MDSGKILTYWCSPFTQIPYAAFSEDDVYRDPMPIIFMGGRGTGKTMFLKYCSYAVQREKAFREEKTLCTGNLLLSYLQKRGGICFYIRIDGPALRSFTGHGVPQEKWDAIFTHFFELQIAKCYMDVIRDLVQNGAIQDESGKNDFLREAATLLGRAAATPDINAIGEIIEGNLEEVTAFRSKITLMDASFEPVKVFPSQYLSFGLVDIARRTIKEVSANMNIIFMIDEYENFSESQQRIVNSCLKFVKPGITFRLGMRLEGFHTFDTISDNEFIKEGRDYRRIVFEDILIKDNDYEQFLIDVARKRLESVEMFRNKGISDISIILGKKADIEKEAIELMANRTDREKHFDLLKYGAAVSSIEEIKDKIRWPQQPLLEMLNILWVIRGIEPERVGESMKEYLEGEKSEDAKKYRMDYVDKYKLSLMFLLASAHRMNKKYYSFPVFSFLSSGIVGNFIELCRRAFQYAFFENRENLLEQGIIEPELQNKAAVDLANTELQMIPRIPKYGDYLYHFANNLGNIFREYHRDVFIRYPETNQFSIDIASVSDEKLQKAFNAAIEWSIIQKKATAQQSTPGSPRKAIYTLNRIFSPAYQITYRTRGGYSEEFSASDLSELMTRDVGKPKKDLGKRMKIEDKDQRDLPFK